MLQRCQRGEVVWYESPLLAAVGVKHGFSTRLGGVSAGPFASLNLGNPGGVAAADSAGNLAENTRRFLGAVGCSDRRLCRVHQVHSNRCLTVTGSHFDSSQQADALVSDRGDMVLSMRVADCVPILLAWEDGSAVAAVHAGWRGLVAGVLPAAIEQLLHLKPDAVPQAILAAIGPCISMASFEVGPEVLAAFESCFAANPPCRRGANGKGQVDLPGAARRQLLAAGLLPERIDGTDHCTFRDADEFFSHRRDGGVTGRLAAVIACR